MSSASLLHDRDLPDHVWVIPAIILNFAGRLQRLAFLLVWWNDQVRLPRAGRCGVNKDVAVNPLDAVANVRGKLRGR